MDGREKCNLEKTCYHSFSHLDTSPLYFTSALKKKIRLKKSLEQTKITSFCLK